MKQCLLPIIFTIITIYSSFGQIVISEINFNSLGTDDTEYIELYNNSATDINLESYRITNVFEFEFPDVVIPAFSYLVLTIDSERMMEVYGIETIQWTSGSLGNLDQIIIQDPQGNQVDFVFYDAFVNEEWASIAAGGGFAYQFCDINTNNYLYHNWQITNNKVTDYGNGAVYGTPGQPNNCVDGPIVTTLSTKQHITEGNSKNSSVYFYLENFNLNPTSVKLTVDPASTASPDDYTLVTNLVSFAGNEDTFFEVVVDITNDDIAEAKENIILNIEPEENVGLSIVEQVELIIYDDDTSLDKGMVLIGVIDVSDTDDFENYGLELFAIKDIPDLSKYSIGVANNGGGTDGIEIPLPAGALNKGDNFFITHSETRFSDFFGVESDFSHPSIHITGNDAIELFENGNVIDVFGELEVNGTGTSWEYTNGWAKRYSDTGPDGNEFDINNWYFSGTQNLTGPVNDDCIAPYILDSYLYTSTQDINQNNLFDIRPTIVNDQLEINLATDFQTSATAEIYNGQGEMVKKINLNSGTAKTNLSVATYPPGMYYLTIRSGRKVETKRFIRM